MLSVRHLANRDGAHVFAECQSEFSPYLGDCRFPIDCRLYLGEFAAGFEPPPPSEQFSLNSFPELSLERRRAPVARLNVLKCSDEFVEPGARA